MSLEFRQRTPGEYAQIVWKRKWLIIMPTIAITIAVAWAVMRLPDIYESTTLVVVKPPSVPNNLVPSLTQDLSLLLNNINQIVGSRSTLEPLIEKYDLYHSDRARGAAMEGLVERMRKDMRVEIDKGREDATSGFRISFRGADPKSTQAVTAELAQQYINAQLVEQNGSATETKALFDQQLKEAKDRLDEVEKRKLEYMQGHLDSLPSTTGSLIAQLSGLREQEKAYITEMGRLRDQRNLLSTQLGDLAKQREQEIQNISIQQGDPKATQAYAELVKRKAQLQSEIDNMLTLLTPKNPDVIAKENEKKGVQAEMDELVNTSKLRIKEQEDRLRSQIDPRLNSIKYNQQLVENELTRQQQQLDQTEAQIRDLEARINGIPSSEVALQSIDRDYQSRKALYDDLLEKKSKIDFGANVVTAAQGEKIQVVDPASLPEVPVAPRRPMLLLLGLVLGLGAGILCAAAAEIPRFLTVQNSEDAEHYTGLPVLIAIPEFLTPEEARRAAARRVMLMAAGIVLTIVSIPALAFLVKRAGLLDRFVS